MTLQEVQRRLLPAVEKKPAFTLVQRSRGPRGVTTHSGRGLQCSSGCPKEVSVCLRDGEACDCVDQEKPWAVLKETGVPQCLIVLKRNLSVNRRPLSGQTVERQHSFLQAKVSDKGVFYLPELSVPRTYNMKNRARLRARKSENWWKEYQ